MNRGTSDISQWQRGIILDENTPPHLKTYLWPPRLLLRDRLLAAFAKSEYAQDASDSRGRQQHASHCFALRLICPEMTKAPHKTMSRSIHSKSCGGRPQMLV